MQTYLVGGAVRDQLLGLVPTERDWLVVGATAEQMLAQGYRQVGADFPVFLHPTTAEEYALARTERKSGQGYHGFTVYADPSVSLEEDLLRRDLTINAMVMTDTGQVIDPYGGQQDLVQKQLRHVGEAFCEDPLRVLRVARFAARFSWLGFVVADETFALMRQMVASGELAHLTPERVWAETVKALTTSTPHVYFNLLHALGALHELWPELDRLFAVPQSPKYHPEGDAGVHTLMVLQAMRKLTDDVACLWAALCHDVGKGITPECVWPDHPNHEVVGVPLVEGLCKRYKLPSAVQALALVVTRWHGDIHKLYELTPEQILSVLDGCDVWRKPERFIQILSVCHADSSGRLGFETAPYPQQDHWMQILLACQQISTASIIAQGITGQMVGVHVREARVQVITNVYKNLHN